MLCNDIIASMMMDNNKRRKGRLSDETISYIIELNYSFISNQKRLTYLSQGTIAS